VPTPFVPTDRPRRVLGSRFSPSVTSSWLHGYNTWLTSPSSFTSCFAHRLFCRFTHSLFSSSCSWWLLPLLDQD
jgi:hypothetical protein